MGEERDLPSLGSRFRERLAADRSRADSPTEDGQYGQGLRREWGKESACLVWGPSWPRPAPPPSLPQTKLGLTGGGHRARLASIRPEPPGLRGSGADPGAPWGWLGWEERRPHSLARERATMSPARMLAAKLSSRASPSRPAAG